MTTEQQPTTEQMLIRHAERQTAAVEKIRDYVFYLLLIVVVGLIVGFFVALSENVGRLG